MSKHATEEQPLQLDAFWSWLKQHPHCILQASTPNAHLYDSDNLHWRLTEEPDRTLVIQLLQAKQILGELLVDSRQAIFVQASSDEDDTQHERAYFEVIGAQADDTEPLITLLLAHGYEDPQHTGAIKH